MTLCSVFLIYLNTYLKWISLRSQKMHLLDLIQGATPLATIAMPNLLPAPIVGMVKDNYDLCNWQMQCRNQLLMSAPSLPCVC